MINDHCDLSPRKPGKNQFGLISTINPSPHPCRWISRNQFSALHYDRPPFHQVFSWTDIVMLGSTISSSCSNPSDSLWPRLARIDLSFIRSDRDSWNYWPERCKITGLFNNIMVLLRGVNFSIWIFITTMRVLNKRIFNLRLWDAERCFLWSR